MAGSRSRLLLALALAPLAGGVLATLASGIAAVIDLPANLQSRAPEIFANQCGQWFARITLTTYGVTLVAGLPLHLALKQLSLSGWPPYALIGLTTSVAAILLAAIVTMGDVSALGDALSDAVPFLYIAAISGVATALFAWLIRRPDRDAPNPPTPAP
jgi:hypothetical protein